MESDLIDFLSLSERSHCLLQVNLQKILDFESLLCGDEVTDPDIDGADWRSGGGSTGHHTEPQGLCNSQ